MTRRQKLWALVPAAIVIGCMGLECSGFARQEPNPKPPIVYDAERYQCQLDSVEGSFIQMVTAPDVAVLRGKLRQAMLRHGGEWWTKLRVRIWDRQTQQWVRLDGTPLDKGRDWLPAEVSCHVGNERF